MVDDRSVHDAAFLAGILREAPVPLWVIDAAGRVSLANPAAARFLGHRDEGDVLGGSSHDLLHRHRPDGSPYPAHECPIITAPGSRLASEWFVTRAGDVRPVRWSTQPIGATGDVLLSFAAADPHATRPAARGLEVPPPSAAASRPRLRAAMQRSIEERFTDATFSTADLARDARLSIRSVQAIFAETNASPAAEIRRRRLLHAKALLERGHSVQSACHGSGFSDADAFARTYRTHFGYPPSRTRPLPHP